MKFTDKNTASLSLPDGKLDHVWWDDDVTGFGIRLRAGGSRKWVYRYRIGGKQRSIILGSAKSVSLSVARKNASTLEARVRLFEDPALDRQNAKLEADNAFGLLAAQYLATRKSEWRPTTFEQNERHLNKYAKPLHRVPLASVSQRSVANLLNSVAAKAGDVTANRVRSTLSAFFGWAIREGIRLPEGNVATYTNERDEKSRERVLSNTELKAIWAACADNDFGAIVKLLLLTGQRKGEIGWLQWDEVHDEQIVLPSSRTKNKRTHTVPLSDRANEILNRFRRDGRKYVFGRADTGFGGWSAGKLVLDASIAGAGVPLEHWALHDLRRTAVTSMAELSVQPHIIEAVVNHRPSTSAVTCSAHRFRASRFSLS